MEEDETCSCEFSHTDECTLRPVQVPHESPEATYQETSDDSSGYEVPIVRSNSDGNEIITYEYQPFNMMKRKWTGGDEMKYNNKMRKICQEEADTGENVNAVVNMPGPSTLPAEGMNMPGPSTLPAEDINMPGPSTLPEEEMNMPGPSTLPAEDINMPGPSTLPEEEMNMPGPSTLPAEEMNMPGPSTLPAEDINMPGPSTLPEEEMNMPGPSTLPAEEMNMPGPSTLPAEDINMPGPSTLPEEEMNMPGPSTLPAEEVSSNQGESSNARRQTANRGNRRPIPQVAQTSTVVPNTEQTADQESIDKTKRKLLKEYWEARVVLTDIAPKLKLKKVSKPPRVLVLREPTIPQPLPNNNDSNLTSNNLVTILRNLKTNAVNQK